MFNLIIFGPPGSGKGTQSDLLIQNFGLIHISTGDLLRDEVEQQTLLGIEAKKFMDQGQLVPDEVVIGMIGSLLDNRPKVKGIIFDGFPRTEAQAKALDKLLSLKTTEIHKVLYLIVPEEELENRLIQRGKESGRSDDNKEVILKRIVEYNCKTKSVADYYESQRKLTKVKGTGSIAEIFATIKSVIHPYVKAI